MNRNNPKRPLNETELEALRIAGDYYDFVKRKVGRKVYNRIHKEDLEQEALLFVLLCYAEPRINDPEYLERKVKAHLQKWIRKECKIGDNESGLPNEEDEDGEDQNPALIDPHSLSDRSDNPEPYEVFEALEEIQPNEQIAIYGHMNGRTQQHTANLLGISQPAVHHTLRRGFQSIRTRLGVA